MSEQPFPVVGSDLFTVIGEATFVDTSEGGVLLNISWDTSTEEGEVEAREEAENNLKAALHALIDLGSDYGDLIDYVDAFHDGYYIDKQED